MTTTKNIVFDLGGVILNFDFEGAKAIFAKLGVSFGESTNQKEAFALLNSYINGFCSETDFAKALLKYCNAGTTLQDVLEELQALDGDLPATRLKKLCRLRENYKVYLLSNINERMWQWAVSLMQQHGFKPEDCFDGVFLSYAMHMAKPDPAIYLGMIEQTGIKPEETVYFDDLQENIDAGLSLGFDAHLVTTNRIEDCKAYLEITNQTNTNII